MPDDKKIIKSENDGFIGSISNYLKLIWRLMKDNRVSLYLKTIPFISLIYLINPFDIPGPFDDATVLWGLTYMFIELCPKDVVEEHRQAIDKEIFGRWKDSSKSKVDEEDIIEADFEEKEPK